MAAWFARMKAAEFFTLAPDRTSQSMACALTRYRTCLRLSGPASRRRQVRRARACAPARCSLAPLLPSYALLRCHAGVYTVGEIDMGDVQWVASYQGAVSAASLVFNTRLLARSSLAPPFVPYCRADRRHALLPALLFARRRLRAPGVCVGGEETGCPRYFSAPVRWCALTS